MLRRNFIKHSLLGSAGVFFFPIEAMQSDPEISVLTILHTNDVHSRIEPFPMDGGRNSGKGGAARRAALIKKIRTERDHVLLLDAGDIFQGTPYFNFFYGEIEMKLMSKMGYDVATIGNHDFDGGIENLAKQLDHASFTMLNCNYELKDTPLKEIVQPFKVFNKGGIKIGIYGLGIELDGLVPKDLFGEARYTNALHAARKYEQILKEEMSCDFIICLSHLGYRYRGSKVSDVQIANGTSETDLIIGGHTHSFLSAPEIYFNRRGNQVLINQVGWAGLLLGQIDIAFEKNRKGKCISCKNQWIESS